MSVAVTWSLVTGMRSYISLLVLLGHSLSKLVLDSLEQIYLGNDLMNDIDLTRLKVNQTVKRRSYRLFSWKCCRSMGRL